MREILYIDSKDTLVPLHHATTTAVQMAHLCLDFPSGFFPFSFLIIILYIV
jgi:hypothetical protein